MQQFVGFVFSFSFAVKFVGGFVHRLARRLVLIRLIEGTQLHLQVIPVLAALCHPDIL
ncbi:putative membrane protein [Bradyrhizobium sp. AZCC 1578]|uniref:hypothetical protein n=1 Tax=Bradyrhizobium sp. AZCC 1578 TaxID=3117027 RepID=UPI002FF32B6A